MYNICHGYPPPLEAISLWEYIRLHLLSCGRVAYRHDDRLGAANWVYIILSGAWAVEARCGAGLGDGTAEWRPEARSNRAASGARRAMCNVGGGATRAR